MRNCLSNIQRKESRGRTRKTVENYSRWDTNTNNNAKEALEALEVHSEIVMEENVSSATLTTWALYRTREIIGAAKMLQRARWTRKFRRAARKGMMELKRGIFNKREVATEIFENITEVVNV